MREQYVLNRVQAAHDALWDAQQRLSSEGVPAAKLKDLLETLRTVHNDIVDIVRDLPERRPDPSTYQPDEGSFWADHDKLAKAKRLKEKEEAIKAELAKLGG